MPDAKYILKRLLLGLMTIPVACSSGSSMTSTESNETNTTSNESDSSTGELTTKFDVSDCNDLSGNSISLIVPSFAKLVAYESVPIYWSVSPFVDTIQVYLSADSGQSYSFLGEVSSTPRFQLWTFDSTEAKQKVLQENANPTGYRIALAAFNDQHELVGCDISYHDFEIRGWPESDFEKPQEIEFLDKNLADVIFKKNKLSSSAATQQELDISGGSVVYKGISSLDGIAHFSGLQTLDAGYNHISSVWDLSWMTQLKELYLTKNFLRSENLKALGTLQALETLDLSYNGLRGLVGLPSSFPLLKDLILAGNGLGDHSLENLPDSPGLQWLDLSGGKIVSIENLPPYAHLKSLDLFQNEILSIKELPSYPELQSLDLQANKIVDVSKLGEYSNLTSLSLAANDVQLGVAELAKLTKLEYLNLVGNSNIPCADQEFVKTSLLMNNPNIKIHLSDKCK